MIEENPFLTRRL